MASGSATVRVEKATSHLLIGPDWTLNMDICDSINSDHWQAKDVVKAVKKRLQHKNPRVQFFALTLLEMMIKNCGDYVHFQVANREVLQEMVKIVKKKTDLQVRDKILVLLDSWQEAFGGPGGKYPQYYWAYADLKRYGVGFPQRSPDSALIFTPPVAHPRPIPMHLQAGYGMPSSSVLRLDEAMASEMGNLSLSDLDSIRSVMELLSDMLQAVNTSDHEAVKDEVIMDLVSQCRTNEKRLMQLVVSTGDEELLGQGLTLNDKLQSLLAKHDAIASGSPLPIEAPQSIPGSSASLACTPTEDNYYKDVDEEEEDEFDQLARRNRPATAQSASSVTGDLDASPNHSDVTTATSTSETSSSVASNALVLLDPPPPVKTSSKEQDIIDLLSITLSTNPSPPHTPLTPSSASNQNGSPLSASPNGQGYPYGSQPYQANQGYTPFNSYVAPWAQQAVSQSQPISLPQPQLQSQSQVSPFSSSYPPPPWATPGSANPNPIESSTYQFPATQASSGRYAPMPASRPLQQYNSFGSRVNNFPASFGQPQVNSNQRQTGTSSAPKPFVPSYRLFEDLIDLRNSDGGLKISSTSSGLPGASGQSMISGRK